MYKTSNLCKIAQAFVRNCTSFCAKLHKFLIHFTLMCNIKMAVLVFYFSITISRNYKIRKLCNFAQVSYFAHFTGLLTFKETPTENNKVHETCGSSLDLRSMTRWFQRRIQDFWKWGPYVYNFGWLALLLSSHFS